MSSSGYLPSKHFNLHGVCVVFSIFVSCSKLLHVTVCCCTISMCAISLTDVPFKNAHTCFIVEQKHVLHCTGVKTMSVLNFTFLVLLTWPHSLPLACSLVQLNPFKSNSKLNHMCTELFFTLIKELMGMSGFFLLRFVIICVPLNWLISII